MTIRNMKNTRIMVLGLLGILFCIPACKRQDRSGKVVIRVASVLPAEHPSSKALRFFEERLDELSSGKVDVKLFLNSQLGSSVETAQMCKMGNLEAAYVSAATMTQFLPEINALTMPFIFSDNHHAYAVVDGEVGDLFREKLRGINLETLAFCDAGSRNIMTKKGPVKTPSDLIGMKIRVMNSPLMVDTINALGASAISLGQGEVYTALQTGMIDGWENNPPTALSFKMYETGCLYYAHTRHLMIPDMFIMDEQFHADLEPNIRGWIDQAAEETKKHQRELWRQDVKETVETLKKAGMKFNDVDLEAFKNKVDGVYDKYYDKYGSEFQDICRQIIGTQ